MAKDDIYMNIKGKKNSKAKILVVVAILFVLIIGGILAYFLLNQKSIAYITQNPTYEDISQDVSATGTLHPTNTVEVGSEVSGTILEVLVDVNDEVKKGQIIAKIDTEKLSQSVNNYEAQLSSAKAELYSAEVQLENKKWNYDNYLALFEKTGGKSPSQLQLKTAELEYKSALADIEVRKANIKQIETSLNSAKIDVKKAIITSPIDGMVLSRDIEPGQTVASSFNTPTLFQIAQSLTEMKLVSSVLEADIGKVKVNQDVEFSVDSYPNEVFRAKISKVNFADTSTASSTSSSSSSSSSSTTSTNIISYEVTTYINNDKLLLRPGMSATAIIKTATAKNALVVPYQALLFSPTEVKQSAKQESNSFMMGGPPKRSRKSYSSNEVGSQGSVWILENGIPKQIEVDIGISNGKNAQILSNNLNSDMQVILQIQK